MIANRGSVGCMKQMVDTYNQAGGNLISVLEVPEQHVSPYGVVAPCATRSATPEVRGLVEKVKLENAPSNLFVFGYILLSKVMNLLEKQTAGAGEEIQLTDAMAQMIGLPFHAVRFAGRRFDCGSKLSFVKATLALALERDDMADEVRAMAKRYLA